MARSGAPQPDVTSRFTGARAFLAPFYKALFPTVLPPDVNLLTPSQIAAMLGLDLVDAVRALPPERAPARKPKAKPKPGQERRIEGVVLSG